VKPVVLKVGRAMSISDVDRVVKATTESIEASRE